MKWVEQATTAHVEVTEAGFAGYGYLWWITDVTDEPGYVAYGMVGQVIHVLSELDLVVAIATEFDERDPARMSTVFGRDSAVGLADIAIPPLGRVQGLPLGGPGLDR